ncbi:MAG: Rieske (2Fe-2S) protein [Chloroherpetonaceae bacterium]|nr:Rieske (2Fe-2S) protein [Chloroherpetonaceae bacterium]MCS7211565.1 Rieske (2Fe-2S) protein [Chloroherpetonaceae bacterium]MDW8019764.1 Rieske (2Fe-2S) protein [Chloroherpetonaceae bacterium]MDW8464793.1 Rieske (2Fe-2S) protein [Chloroherpetonaceae bacterium]
MAQIVRGEYDRSKRLAVISETDQERREAVEQAQKAVQEGAATMGTGRRDVLNIIVGALATAFILPVLYVIGRFVVPPERKKKEETSVVVAKTSDVPPNTGKIVLFNNQKLLLMNVGGEYKAISAICTHLQCIVQWKQDEQVVWCACHNAKYTSDGEKISGPQPAGLAKYVVKVKDDNIVVEKA